MLHTIQVANDGGKRYIIFQYIIIYLYIKKYQICLKVCLS